MINLLNKIKIDMWLYINRQLITYIETLTSLGIEKITYIYVSPVLIFKIIKFIIDRSRLLQIIYLMCKLLKLKI